jgi:hypothetical protein
VTLARTILNYTAARWALWIFLVCLVLLGVLPQGCGQHFHVLALGRGAPVAPSGGDPWITRLGVWCIAAAIVSVLLNLCAFKVARWDITTGLVICGAGAYVLAFVLAKLMWPLIIVGAVAGVLLVLNLWHVRPSWARRLGV